MRKASTIVRRALLCLAAVVLVDLASSLTWLRSGKVGRRPLPPFGRELDAEQLEVLDRLERGEVNPHTVTGLDRVLGWTWRPGAEHANGDYHVNARGLRGLREYAPAPASGKLRLACFGDSFTFGDEIPDAATFQAILESRDR